MAFSCSRSITYHVAFNLVEKALLLWIYVLRGRLMLPHSTSPPSLEKPLLSSLPTSLSEVLAQVAGLQVETEEQGESWAQGRMKREERALCPPTPNPSLLCRGSGPSARSLTAAVPLAFSPSDTSTQSLGGAGTCHPHVMPVGEAIP